MTTRLDVRCLDTRRRFQDYDDRHRPTDPGQREVLTEDGEHLSALGVRLLSREVARSSRG